MGGYVEADIEFLVKEAIDNGDIVSKDAADVISGLPGTLANLKDEGIVEDYDLNDHGRMKVIFSHSAREGLKNLIKRL